MLNITDLQGICSLANIEITLHAAKRLEQRGISVSDVISCIKNGEIIEQYPDDYPLPSCLILGPALKHDMIHAVIGSDLKTIWIITAYIPAPEKWKPDLRLRKEDQS